jgi:hypothetical protein
LTGSYLKNAKAIPEMRIMTVKYLFFIKRRAEDDKKMKPVEKGK